MGNGKVETFLSNDGKTRLKGNVGSHSTLVTQAKTPTADINKVKIESIVPKFDNNHLIINARDEEKLAKDVLDKAQSAVQAAHDANPELVAARDRMKKDDSYEAASLVDKIKNSDPNILRADNEYISARINLYRLVNKRELLETKYWLATAEKLHYETVDAAVKLRDGIPELEYAFKQCGKSEDDNWHESVAYYQTLLKKYPEVLEAFNKEKIARDTVWQLQHKLSKLRTVV